MTTSTANGDNVFISKSNMFSDFLSLIFPNLCAGCDRGLQSHEDCICTFCHYQLPQTDYHLMPDNPVSKLFSGRVNLHSAASYYTFTKASRVQRLIHALKYKRRGDIGITIGRFYGCALKNSQSFKSVNLIMPVPLHKNKLKKRGYNQSECFAKGLSDTMAIPVDCESLIRIEDTDTQTKKSRYERWQNIESGFSVTNGYKLIGKHILLVDDVVTTGATLEACAEQLLKIINVSVSIATIAYAEI